MRKEREKASLKTAATLDHQRSGKEKTLREGSCYYQEQQPPQRTKKPSAFSCRPKEIALINFFAGAQAFAERSGLGSWRCAQLLVEQLHQLLVVLERPAPFTQRRLTAHQLPVRLLQQPVVGYGIAVEICRLRVAPSGGEEPPQEE